MGHGELGRLRLMTDLGGSQSRRVTACFRCFESVTLRGHPLTTDWRRFRERSPTGISARSARSLGVDARFVTPTREIGGVATADDVDLYGRGSATDPDTLRATPLSGVGSVTTTASFPGRVPGETTTFDGVCSGAVTLASGGTAVGAAVFGCAVAASWASDWMANRVKPTWTPRHRRRRR
jgi:hypothetical protein